MSPLPPLKLRPMADTDRSLVINSWVRSFAELSPDARDYVDAAMGLFGTDYTKVVLALMKRSAVVVASLADSPDSVLGWMCWEGDLLHYVLVKPRWRELGLARWMLQDFASMPVTYTHRTRRAPKRCPACPPGPEWVFQGKRCRLCPAPKTCKVPDGWTYRRWLIWPQEKAA